MNKADSEKLKSIAQQVINKAGLAKDEKFGSVIAILMIISIVLTCIRVLQECNKRETQSMALANKCLLYKAQIKEYSNRRGWFTRMRIKKLLRREMAREDYEKYGLRLMEAILDTGECLTDDEITTLVENANV